MATSSDPPGREVHLLTGRHQRYAFGGLPQPGLTIHRVGEGDPPPPDILLLPCGTTKSITYSETVLANLPEAVRARVASGGTAVVFDDSMEGRPHEPLMMERLERWLAMLGAEPRQAVYLTQDRLFAADDLAWRRATGRRPMTVLHHDYWIWAFTDQFATGGAELFERRLEIFRDRPAHRARRFVSLNFTARPTKVLFLLSLMRDGLWDEGFISFGGFEDRRKMIGQGGAELLRRMATLPGFGDLAAEVAPNLERLRGYGRVLFGALEFDGRSPLYDPTLPEYADSWFSIVTETEMMDRPCRITEKAMKPLVNFHPFVMFGNPRSLKLVEDLGFVSFPEMFDEAYDEELPIRSRFDLAYRQVRRLCALDEAQLLRLEAAVAERVIHNARWGLTQFPVQERGRVHARLLNDILAATRV